MSPAELLEDRIDLDALIARSRANVAWSRRLCRDAGVTIARSMRLCPTAIAGASDASTREAVGPLPASNGHGYPAVSERQARRFALVLAGDAMLRALVADAISAHHDVGEASDVPRALKVLTSGVRVDVVVVASGDEAQPAEAATAAVRQLYAGYPWLPVVMIADALPPTLKAEVLLTGVRAFLPKDFTAAELLATVTRVARRNAPVPTAGRVAAIKETFTVLERAITDVPALASLAALAAMSRSHFSRTFHAVAGICLRDYVRDLRLKRSLELMRTSHLSLTAIATEAGFYDLPHFNKAFRHRFDMSPTQFRLVSQSPPPAT